MPRDDKQSKRAKAIYEDWGVEPERQPIPQASKSGAGFSPGQRFLIALLLFLIVLIVGFSCLVLTGRIWLL